MLRNNLQKMAYTEGLAVVASRCSHETSLHYYWSSTLLNADERDRWAKLLNGTVDLLGVAKDNRIRVQLKEHVINAQEEDGCIFVIVSLKGHSVAKSLQRLVRRGLKATKKSSQVVPASREEVQRAVETYTKPALERRTPEHLTTDPAVPEVVEDRAATRKIDP